MSGSNNSFSKSVCTECGASFLTSHGLDVHFEKQHGIYCETCPIDIITKKIVSIFKQK